MRLLYFLSFQSSLMKYHGLRYVFSTFSLSFQSNLMKYHGLQCGFCTPGMVMTMYTLFRNNPQPSQQDLERALEGRSTYIKSNWFEHILLFENKRIGHKFLKRRTPSPIQSWMRISFMLQLICRIKGQTNLYITCIHMKTHKNNWS